MPAAENRLATCPGGAVGVEQVAGVDLEVADAVFSDIFSDAGPPDATHPVLAVAKQQAARLFGRGAACRLPDAGRHPGRQKHDRRGKQQRAW